MKLKYPALLALFMAPVTQASDLVISGVYDGPLTGGTPKGVELYVLNDIADLSTCGVGFANNGGGTDGQEFTFPAGSSATAGSYLFVASESPQFSAFFGFAPTFTNAAANINGDDAVELFCNGTVVDVFGDIDVDGTETAWDSMDGWAYRNSNTGPDGSSFVIANWTFSGINGLENGTTNDTTSSPFPIQSYTNDNTGGDTGGDTGGTVISGNVCTNCPDLEKYKDLAAFNATDYYAAVQTEIDLGSSAQVIKTTINSTISSDIKSLTYAEVWTALTYTDEDPSNTDNVILWYTARSQAKSTNGSGAASTNPDNWNREHSWPKSHGFPDEGQLAYTDIHHLRPSDISVNGSRSNLDFDNSDSPLAESPSNRIDSDSFEPRDDIKGDVARMMFYMDTRYEGAGSDNVSDLVLVNRLTSAAEPNLGFLCTLIAWNNADLVDTSEQSRNDRIYELQGNRNPFIDNPSWVATLYPAESCDTSGGDTGGGDTGGGDTGGGDTGGDTSGGETTLVFINEIHYDNASTDSGEGIEIAGLAGTDLAGMSLVSYNGSNGTSYSITALTGIIPDQESGFGTVWFAISGLQNGAPDGVALVAADGTTVLQFLSYEGAFEATNGPAIGITSTDIGVAETSSTPVGESLQLVGSGFRYEDFTWQGAAASSNAAINNGQTFVAPAPFINEIHYDNSGADSDEGVEIAGLAGIDLTGMSLVPYNGSNGTTYSVTALSGVIPNQQGGFGTLWFAISNLQNGTPDGVALVAADGAVLQFLSYEGAFAATNGPAIGLTSTDLGVAETGSTPVGQSMQLSGSGVQYSDFTWQAPATSTLGLVNNDQTLGAGGAGGDTGGETVELGVCADPATLISNIQGSGSESPVEGDDHVVEAIVSASFANLSGFFIQEEAADMDADSQTSEGLFVYYTGTLPEVGSIVRVLGKVEEKFEKTQLSASEAPLVCGTDVIVATSFSLPFANALVPESLEGMLVSASSELVVTDNYSLGRYGEVALAPERLFVPTNLYVAGSPEAIALAAKNALSKITLDDGMNGSNPEPVIYPTGELSAVNTLRGGDTVSSLTGVMDFSFNLYRIIPTEAPTFAATNPRTAEPELTQGNLKVASLNVLNLFNGDGQGAGFPTARGASTAAELERQMAKTVAALAAMDADIVGLMEIENDSFTPTSAIAQLTDRLNAAVGADVYSFVDGGGVIGTDEIKVALLYKPGKVVTVGSYKILNSINSITDEQGPLFVDTRNRPAFNQKFALLKNGEEIVISVNHLKSKGSKCGAGDDDTTTGQGNCNLTRTRAAKALLAFLAQEYANAPTLIIGDLNSYAQEEPILTVKQAGYTDLANLFQGNGAYSYVFGGEFGYLDHALASASLVDKVVDTVEWHINADEPIVLDYNVEFKSAQQQLDFYSADAYRMSDHDPVLISMLLKIREDYDGDDDVDQRDIVELTKAIAKKQVIDSRFDLNGDGVINIRDVRIMQQRCTRRNCATN
jgi:predicted extracellular nuclease/endonuclease I